jgi:hypothetical protein
MGCLQQKDLNEQIVKNLVSLLDDQGMGGRRGQEGGGRREGEGGRGREAEGGRQEGGRGRQRES